MAGNIVVIGAVSHIRAGGQSTAACQGPTVLCRSNAVNTGTGASDSGWATMPLTQITFHETDHLTRIQFALKLEDVGFVVREDGDAIVVTTDRDAYARRDLRCPTPAKIR